MKSKILSIIFPIFTGIVFLADIIVATITKEVKLSYFICNTVIGLIFILIDLTRTLREWRDKDSGGTI